MDIQADVAKTLATKGFREFFEPRLLRDAAEGNDKIAMEMLKGSKLQLKYILEAERGLRGLQGLLIAADAGRGLSDVSGADLAALLSMVHQRVAKFEKSAQKALHAAFKPSSSEKRLECDKIQR